MLYRPQVAYSLKENSLVTSLKMKSFVECEKRSILAKYATVDIVTYVTYSLSIVT